jgi:hypothetical protein
MKMMLVSNKAISAAWTGARRSAVENWMEQRKRGRRWRKGRVERVYILAAGRVEESR